MAASSKSLAKVCVALGLTVGSIVLTPSCRADQATLFIRQIQAPIPPDCTVKNDQNALSIGRGLLDTGLSTRYLMNALIGNQMVARGDAKLARSEPNRVIVKGADVHIFDDTQTEKAFYSVVATGVADPTSGSDPGYGIAQFEVIPHSIGTSIANELRALVAAGKPASKTFEAHFKVFGTTLGGTDVESAEYIYPIDVCFGCTIQFPADANDTTISGPPNCGGKVAAAASASGVILACLPGQDGETDCRSCQGSPVCTPCGLASDLFPYSTFPPDATCQSKHGAGSRCAVAVHHCI